MGFRLSFAVSNVFIWGLIVSVCFFEKSLFIIIKIIKNKLIEYKSFAGKKLFTSRMKTFDTAKESLDPILSLK